jgi:hypothetical protein
MVPAAWAVQRVPGSFAALGMTAKTDNDKNLRQQRQQQQQLQPQEQKQIPFGDDNQGEATAPKYRMAAREQAVSERRNVVEKVMAAELLAAMIA